MYTGFEDLEAQIGALEVELSRVRDERDEAKAEHNKLRGLFCNVYDERDELKKTVAELEAKVEELEDGIKEAIGLHDDAERLQARMYHVLHELTK